MNVNSVDINCYVARIYGKNICWEGEIVIVGFTGRCCSGKTTVFEKFKEKHPEYGYVPEFVDEVLSKYGVTLGTLRYHSGKYLQFQLEILRRYVNAVDKAYRKYDVIITDRTLYDIFIYSKLYLPERYFNMFRIELFLLDQYMPDKLIYFEPLPYTDNGIRHRGRLERELELFERYVKPKADAIVNVKEEDFSSIEQKILSVIGENNSKGGVENDNCK